MKLSEIQILYQASDDPSERMEYISALVDIEQADWSLIEAFAASALLTDDNPIVRHEAAFVLGELRETDRISDEVGAAALRQAAQLDISAVVRHEATEALYCFCGDSIDATLRQCLEDEDEDVRLTAAMSLSWRDRWKRDADTIERLRDNGRIQESAFVKAMTACRNEAE